MRPLRSCWDLFPRPAAGSRVTTRVRPSHCPTFPAPSHPIPKALHSLQPQHPRATSSPKAPGEPQQCWLPSALATPNILAAFGEPNGHVPPRCPPFPVSLVISSVWVRRPCL